MNQDWNDPKSKLQQCCLTLRTMDNVEPDIPIYKYAESRSSKVEVLFVVNATNFVLGAVGSSSARGQPTLESTPSLFTSEIRDWPRQRDTAFSRQK